MPHITAAFVIHSQEPRPNELTNDAGIDYGMLRIEKTFTGAIEGTSVVEMLFTRTPGDAGSFAGGGYVALERITGSVEGRGGSFALLHVATIDEDSSNFGLWLISPGSGTGELARISGSGRIDIAEDGSHSLQLDYELG